MLDCFRAAFAAIRALPRRFAWLATLMAGLVVLSIPHDGHPQSQQLAQQLAQQFVTAAPATQRTVIVLSVQGAISPASADYIIRGMKTATKENAPLVILRMDTPGGLDTSMRAIIQAIVNAPMPVATFVAPSGARAASAGTYILYASHIAAMAPGTNLGAATPVQMGGVPSPVGAPDKDKSPLSPTKNDKSGDTDAASSGDPMAHKMTEDAVAYIRSLAEMRGRNADWGESAVRKASSLSSQEALKQKVIDLVARDEMDLLRQADGREVGLRGEPVTLHLGDVALREIAPDWRNELLATITNPNVAFILMMIGIYGIIFEFINPGSFIPGTVGAIALLVAFYALNILPINYAGLALVLLGMALLVAEAFLPTFGIVGFGGIAALILGATMLIDTEVPGFAIAWPVIATTAAASAGFLLLVAGLALRAQRRPVVTGREQMIGSHGTVLSWSEHGGRVLTHGETWQAVSDAPLAAGQSVTVRALRGLILVVAPDNA